MEGIEFEENGNGSGFGNRNVFSIPKEFMTERVMRWSFGLIKTKKQAMVVLFCIIIFCFVMSFALLFRSENDPRPYYAPVPVTGEIPDKDWPPKTK